MKGSGFGDPSYRKLDTLAKTIETFNFSVSQSPGQGYGGARCPAYGFGSFRNQSENEKLNDPTRKPRQS